MMFDKRLAHAVDEAAEALSRSMRAASRDRHGVGTIVDAVNELAVAVKGLTHQVAGADDGTLSGSLADGAQCLADALGRHAEALGDIADRLYRHAEATQKVGMALAGGLEAIAAAITCNAQNRGTP
jgi:hypothetical protein